MTHLRKFKSYFIPRFKTLFTYSFLYFLIVIVVSLLIAGKEAFSNLSYPIILIVGVCFSAIGAIFLSIVYIGVELIVAAFKSTFPSNKND